MKESNILVGNAANISVRADTLLNTKGQYMTVSNILVGNAAYNSLIREVLQDTIDLYIKANKQ